MALLSPSAPASKGSYTGGSCSGKSGHHRARLREGKSDLRWGSPRAPDLARALLTLIQLSGVKSTMPAPRGVEVTSRRSDRRVWTYLLNHTATPQIVNLAGTFNDILNQSP